MKYCDLVQVFDESILTREVRHSNNHKIISFFNYTNTSVNVTVDNDVFTDVSHICLLGDVDTGVRLFVPVDDDFTDFQIDNLESVVVDS